MMCCENSEEEKYENGEEENKQESKNLDVDERKVYMIFSVKSGICESANRFIGTALRLY